MRERAGRGGCSPRGLLAIGRVRVVCSPHYLSVGIPTLLGPSAFYSLYINYPFSFLNKVGPCVAVCGLRQSVRLASLCRRGCDPHPIRLCDCVRLRVTDVAVSCWTVCGSACSGSWDRAGLCSSASLLWGWTMCGPVHRESCACVL